MAYVTESYYGTTYFGVSAGTDFNRLAARASDDVDLACLNSIVLADLDAGQLALLQKATCAQIEFYVQNGDDYNESIQGGGESIGSFSHSGGAPMKKPAGLCPRAKAYLEQSGLMSRCVRLLGDSKRRWQDFDDE